MSAAPVTVWRVALDAGRPPDPVAVAELSADERARAARFATDALRNRWLHGHVALRRILARELGVAPAAIAYATGEHGKPWLARPRASGVEFSYADATTHALVAVSRLGAVGVDIEPVDRQVDVLAIAASRFAAHEADAIRAAPPDQRQRIFYRLWTRKEAVLKAIGVGLTGGLDQVDESVWRVHDLVLDEVHHAALATTADARPVIADY